jgi:hypothetical protein
MPSTVLTFRLVPRLAVSSIRAVGFLAGHSELNAWPVFDGLGDKRPFLANLGHWVAGNNSPTTRFHGFPNDADHKQCFVLKHKNDRFYAFLCNPLPNTNPGFRLCALCIYATKNERQTDTAELDRAEQWRNNIGAKKAIALVFPDKEEKKKK